MNIEIPEKNKQISPIYVSIRMWVVPMYPLWSSMAMSIVAYNITYSSTILVGLRVKSALC